MRESMWGIFIIVLGAVGIIAINLFQSLTVTNDQTYFLMKETTKAAMGDAVDLSYYRSTGKIRIVEEKFVENLTRRFAQSAALNKNYNIVIHDVVEEPPKVSVSILTNAQDMKQGKYDIFQKIDAIYETMYKKEDLFDIKYFKDYDYIPGIPETVPEDIYEDGKCPNSEAGIDECISGDLQFLRWEDLTKFNYQICPEELNNLEPIDRDAFYQVCKCEGEWADEQSVTINSGKPKRKDNIATYEWVFIKDDGPINDINEIATDKVIADNCVEDLKILIIDDLPGTTWGGTECPPEGIVIFPGQVQTLYPRYIQKDAVDRNLEWSKNNDNISLLELNGTNIFYPNKDYVTVTGRVKGETEVKAKSTNVESKPCKIRVIDDVPPGFEPDFECPANQSPIVVGGTFQPSIVKGVNFPVDYTIKYEVFNKTMAEIINPLTGLIKGLIEGSTNYIVTVGINRKQYTKTCPFEIIESPPPEEKFALCPSANVIIQTYEDSKQATVVNPFNLPITSFSVSDTDFLSINSTGLMSVESRALEDRYLSYHVTFNGAEPIDCDVILKGKEPHPDPKTECDVGAIIPLWDQAVYNMRNMCITTVNNATSDVNLYLKDSVIEIPIMQCGKRGNIVGTKDSCRGSWTTEIFSYKADSVFMKPLSYYGVFIPVYKYSNWQPSSLNCDRVIDNAEEPLGKHSSKGLAYYIEGSPQCLAIFCDPLDGGCTSEVKVTGFTYPAEVLPNTGEYSVKFNYTVSSLTLRYSSTCKLTGKPPKGSLVKVSEGYWNYFPPKTVKKGGETDGIYCQVDQDPNAKGTGTIKIVDIPCEGFEIKRDRNDLISGTNSVYNKTNISLIFEKESAYNALVSFRRIYGSIEKIPTNTTSKTTVYAIVDGSDNAKVVGIRQLQGACIETTVDFYPKVCRPTEAKYDCTSPNYPNLDGDKCYSITEEKPKCDENDTQILFSGKCYTRTSLPLATPVASGCQEGISTIVSTGENSWTCRSNTSTSKNLVCDTANGYSPYPEEELCIKKRTYTTKPVFKTSKTYLNDTCISIIINACGPGSSNCYSCKVEEKTYSCSSFEIFNGIQYCTQEPTSACPTDGKTYHIVGGKCYVQVEPTKASYSCTGGTLVAINRCIYSVPPTPTSVGNLCTESPVKYVKMKIDGKNTCVLDDKIDAAASCP